MCDEERNPSIGHLIPEDDRYLKRRGGPDRLVPFRAPTLSATDLAGYTFVGLGDTGLRGDPETGFVWWRQNGLDVYRMDLGGGGATRLGGGTWLTGGTGDAYTITPAPALPTYTEGDSYLLRIDRVNTGAVTLNVSGLGPKSIRKTSGDELAPGDLQIDAVILVTFSGLWFHALAGLQHIDGGTF